MSFLREYWWGILFGVLVVLWTWRRSRVARRATGAGASTRSEFVAEGAAAVPLARAYVEGACQELRRLEPPWLEGVLVLLVIATPFMAIALLPDVDKSLVVVIGTAPGLLMLWAWQRRHERVARNVGLTCPRCGAGQSEVLLYLGRCASCGAQLLDPRELRPMPPPAITEGTPFRNVIGLLVLVTLLAWSLYHVARVLSRR